MLLTIAQEGNVVLKNISWQEFEDILIEMGDSRSSRIAYDRGTLEIIMPLQEHEYFKEIISLLVQDLADELGLDYECLGSTTWKRKDLLAGVEPDNCFYIQNEPLIRGNLNINLSEDPPPDLALEIDMTSKSLNRQVIYARLGVAEIWRYDEGILTIYHLQDGEYIESERSLAFPDFPIKEIPAFVKENLNVGRRVIRKLFRAWLQNLS
jgi:Uma2 family endonuclease